MTERRKTDDTIRESEKRFAALVRVSAQAVWVADAAGAMVEFSPTWSAFTGQTVEEMKGWGRLSAIHPDDHATVKSEWKKAIAARSPIHLEYRLRHVSGEWRWTTMRAVPLLDDEGAIRSWVAMNTDITERRAAEQGLRDSENRKSAILNAALDAIITMDHHGKVTDFNPAAEKIFGYSSRDVVGKLLETLIIPERLRERHREGMKRYLATDEGPALGRRIEMPALRADGTEFPVELSISRISNIEPPMFTATLRDITERKRMEGALRDTAERLRATFNQAAVGIAIAALDGHFLEVNAKFSAILGYTPEELRERTFIDITHQEDLSVTQKSTAELRDGKVHDIVYEKRYVRKDGTFVWSLTTVTLLKDESGKPQRYIGVIEDITLRKNAESEVRLGRERLELALAAGGLGDWEWNAADDLVSLSPRAAQVFGLRGQSITWTRIREVLHIDDRERARLAVEKALAEHSNYSIDYRVIRPGGELAWVAARGRGRYTADGRVEGMSGVVIDVTEHKQAEEARSLLAAVVESSDDAIISMDLNAIVTTWNTGAVKIFGYTAPEIVGKSITFLIPPGRENEEPAILARLVTGERIEHYETVRVTKDGTPLHVSLSVSPILDAQGKIVGASKISRDITARKRVEEALAASDQFNRSIIESSRDCIKVLDPEGRLLSMASSGQRMLEFSDIQPYLNKSWVDFWKEEDRARAAAAVHAAADGEASTFTAYCPTVAGTPKWWNVLITPILDASGKPEKLLAVSRDVTERREAEEALRRSERLLSDFFENSALGLHWVGPDGIILRANRTELEMLGYSAEEYVGRSIAEFHADAPVITDILERLSCGKTLEGYEARLRCKDGSIKHVVIHSNVLWEDGKFVHTRCFTRDITRQKQAEAEQARLTSVLERSLNEIYIFDPETLRFEYVNEGARRNLGFTIEQMRQKTPLDIKPELAEPQFREMVKPLLAGENEKLLFHTIHRRADGTDYPVEVHLQAVTHADRRVFLAVILDITERKKAEEKLRRSEDELRALANSMPQLAWMAEPDGHIFWYNHRWYEYTGTTHEQMQGWGWQSVHDPKMLPLVVERWKQSLATGEPFYMEFPLRGADGIFRWFLTRVNAVRDSEGRITRWFGTNTDVDTVRKAQEALREETRILELLNDTGSAIAANLDLQRVVQTVTDAATKLTGAQFGAFFYNVVNAQGESFLLYTLSGAPREAFEKFGHPRATPLFGPTFRGEGVIRSGDILNDPRYGKMPPHHGMPKGHLPVRSYLAVPVISRNGEVVGGLFFGHPEPDVFTERAERLVVGVAAQAAIAIDNARLYDAAQKEITRRTQAEEALAGRVRLAVLRAEISSALAMNEDLRTVLQRCTEAMVRNIDAAFARVWTVNEHEQVLELCASAGMYTHLDGPHSRIKVGEYKIGRIAKNHEPHLTNDVANDPNISDPEWARQQGMVAFAGYPLMVEGRVNGVVALFARHPLSEEVFKELSLVTDGLAQWIQRKQAERALGEAQKELSRHAENLEKEVATRTASLREAITQLEEFSYSVSHDLRSPLRAIAGYNRIFREDFGATLPANAHVYLEKITRSTERMERLVNDVLTMSRVARADIALHPISLQRFIEEIIEQHSQMQAPAADVTIHAPHEVIADDASLGQALSNLLTNAVKFLPADRKPVVTVRSEQSAGLVRIWIADNGIGIPPQHRAKLFGMFQRLPAALKYEGTGIGLAIVRKAVERMGGTVGMESNAPTGSRFWIELKGAR